MNTSAADTNARHLAFTDSKMPVTVLLDDVRSMANVGSVFRTCDAFAVNSLVLCGITACPPHREIERSALGATAMVSWRYEASAVQAVRALAAAGVLCLGVEQVLHAQPLLELEWKLNQPVALVFGNEVNGVSQGVLAECLACVEIPQSGMKRSLNVSVAAGVVLWEFYRRWRL